ncbi:hypothetical protein QL093DRAFT_2090194 [Fusarium oxysporum]|nr:hypothetical protein QL093DRAFT_2090194 [Fusarium oxysporum]
MKGRAKRLAEAPTKGKKSQKDAPKPWTRQQASYMAQYDVILRIFGGDTAGAEAAMQAELAKEALSSTPAREPGSWQTCRVEDAARAAIDLVQGDLEATYSWIYNTFLISEKPWPSLNLKFL